ncbi:MAG: c-type cytochrome [Comamonas sp.]
MNKTFPTIFALVVASVTGLASAQEVKGDAKAAESKIAMCIGCHGIVGYKASFPEVYQVPKISGQNAKYIEAALHAYKKGDRRHPTMRAIADSLSEQDIADLAAYYEGHTSGEVKIADKPSKVPSTQVAELLKKGTCASCHGDNFSKALDPSYPKLAGQNADYLYVALKSYTVEHNNYTGRSQPVMGAMAKQFNHAEMKALSNYIGGLDGGLQIVPESRFRQK